MKLRILLIVCLLVLLAWIVVGLSAVRAETAPAEWRLNMALCPARADCISSLSVYPEADHGVDELWVWGWHKDGSEGPWVRPPNDGNWVTDDLSVTVWSADVYFEVVLNWQRYTVRLPVVSVGG